MGDFLLDMLPVIFDLIFETYDQIFSGALEGMWNRINGRFW
jgi:hypothetical protein